MSAEKNSDDDKIVGMIERAASRISYAAKYGGLSEICGELDNLESYIQKYRSLVTPKAE